MSGNVPWSAYKELWTRRRIMLDWFLFWSFFGLSLLFVGIGSLVSVSFALSAFGCLAAAFDQSRQSTKLDAMLENKPRNAVPVTHFVRLRPWQTEMHCACGDVVTISQAKWYPNEFDPGGGRYAIVCKCGVGYFKLRDV